MKKSKPCLPRKLKKAIKGLVIYKDTGEVRYNWHFRVRSYPRTRWVVKAERQFIRTWRELKAKDARIKELEAQLQMMKDLKELLPN
jgi:hypothetical protein